jgi:flagellar hook-length control protein FliK
LQFDPLDGATSAVTPLGLEELGGDAGSRRVAATLANADARAAAAASASTASPAAAQGSAAAAVAPPPDAARQMFKAVRDDAQRAPQAPALVGDTPLGGRIDWLPGAAASGAPPSAPTPPTIAQPSAPVDVRTPSWHEAFAGRVQWLVDTHVGEARIKLHPPELGALDVKISLVEDKSYVQLTAATPAARDELLNGLPRLRELFDSSGLNLGGASVESGHAGHRDPRGDVAAESRPSELRAIAPFAADETRPHGRGAGRIDVFA